ncbi:MAG TPA: zinc-dependent metalloprotease [Frankiaceae bacterium]|nr:zinc-dependent metalloprotease [Frankiaceae bacterium]
MAEPELVDWDIAVATGRRLVRPGPQLTRAEADEIVADLRELAVEAEKHVVEYTRLIPQGAAPPVVVVDRKEWLRSNVAGLRAITTPLLGKLAARSGSGPVSRSIGRRITGVQIGGALAFLAGKVLGQFEVFLPPDEVPGPGGRLALVAPNIAEVERKIGAVPRDFRLWVCLHEQTHRVQFHAVPWLRGHLESEVAAFVDATDLDPSALAARIKSAISAVRRRDGTSLVEAMQTPEQRAVLDRMQALMSLLEGHADQVMDAVGPQVVPTVAAIRQAFEARRDGGSPLDRLVRRLLGLDLKMQQYRQGGAFVRAVVEAVGVDGFNEVWTSPETLPTRAEISDPKAWMQRVLAAPVLGPTA